LTAGKSNQLLSKNAIEHTRKKPLEPKIQAVFPIRYTAPTPPEYAKIILKIMNNATTPQIHLIAFLVRLSYKKLMPHIVPDL
jgi:hypothetical protein